MSQEPTIEIRYKPELEDVTEAELALLESMLAELLLLLQLQATE